MIVTEEQDEWEDSKTIGRKRQWFSIEEALTQLALHKPTQRHYLQQMRNSKNSSSPSENCIHIVTNDPEDELEGEPTSATAKTNENRTTSPPSATAEADDAPTTKTADDPPVDDAEEMLETTF